MQYDNKHRSVDEDMFDLLLDKFPIESCTLLMKFAIVNRNVYCIKKLIEKGTRLHVLDYADCYFWSRIAQLGNVELLKCMLNHGIDKDTTDQNGLCVLWYVVDSNNVEAVCYLLALGVVIPTCRPKAIERQTELCKANALIVGDITMAASTFQDRCKWKDQLNKDPCMTAICDNNLEIVKLLFEHGSQSGKSFNALRCAVFYGNVEVTSYLLNNYKYPLNIEYTMKSDPTRFVYTLLTEPRLKPRCKSTAKITKLLLDHGADPAKQMRLTTSVNGIMMAMRYGNVDVIAQYIRSGVDINFRSSENMLPFEASVLRNYYKIAEMLFLSGCSCGVFSLKRNHKFKNKVKPKVKKLMKEWKVQENMVTSLKLRCRNVILNHLSPRADIKIGKLPLPTLIIKFLSIPEIDAIVDAQK